MAAVLLSPQLPAQAAAAQSAVPDLAGIKIGMTAQQAYDALKARAHGAQIGVGQYSVAGVTDKPVPTEMSVMIPDAVPAQTITVWLTTPPLAQTVWAVGLEQKYPESGKLLKSTIVDALRAKFGPEANVQYSYWAFDAQGHPAKDAGGCINGLNFTLAVQPPGGATYDYVTPLIYPMTEKTACDSIVDVRTQFGGVYPGGYFSDISVIETDRALVRKAKEAYSTYLANADAAKKKEELDKAKQQKAPAF